MAPVVEDERQQTDDWRAEQWERLGFDDMAVRMLVAAEADYHRAERMLEAGCSRADCYWILV